MSQRGFSSPVIIILVVLLIGLMSVMFIKKDTDKPLEATPAVQEEPIKTPDQRALEYFLRDNLVQFPKFQALVSPSKIKRIFPITAKDSGQGWLVEVESNSNAELFSYYLLTPTIEQELQDVKSTPWEDRNATCVLESVQEIGNEPTLGRKLKEESGYIVLSGKHCTGYGAANSGFVSVYSIDSGKKVKLTGEVIDPTNRRSGVSATGNAVGQLRGIYGVNNPTLVVEYGNFESTSRIVEQVSLVAYFDLQSGKLQQIVKFQ